MTTEFHKQMGLVIGGGLVAGFVMSWLFGMYTSSSMMLQSLFLPLC
ncbi:MAG: hypothetical protein ABR558_01815 [Thioalkalivibrio sp.]